MTFPPPKNTWNLDVEPPPEQCQSPSSGTCPKSWGSTVEPKAKPVTMATPRVAVAQEVERVDH